MMITALDLVMSTLAEEGLPADQVDVIDVHFLKVGVRPDADRKMFVDFTRERLLPGTGTFHDVTLDDLAMGLSYITLGAWIGEQHDALLWMAFGAHFGFWTILTPENTMNLEGEAADHLAGSGFVLTSGITDEFRTLIEANPS